MLKEIYTIMKSIAEMNGAGIELLAEAARDIIGRKRYRKADDELTPAQFDKQVEQVLFMANRGQ